MKVASSGHFKISLELLNTLPISLARRSGEELKKLKINMRLVISLI